MRKTDNLPPYCAVVKKSRSLNFLDPFGPAWPVTGVLYIYISVGWNYITVIPTEVFVCINIHLYAT